MFIKRKSVRPMTVELIALSFALGAFSGAVIYLLCVSAARSREADRRLREERLRRAARWGGMCIDGLTIFDLPEHPIVTSDTTKGGAEDD